MSPEISKDLEILRLKDDIEQAGKEIKHLQKIIDNLVSDQSSHNESISRMSIENNALRLERDDLKGVIKLADDGITDLNTHWKEKFFTWRETEMQLLEEIEKLKEESDVLKEKYELKFKKQHLENTKLAALVEDCKEENCKLLESLEKSEEELKLISSKLSDESRKNLQNQFISRENDLLTEKVKVLENKVDSFYEESIRQNSASVSVAEKDEKNRSPSTVNNYINQTKSLTEKLLAKEIEVKDLQEEMNRLSYINESQNCKLKQLRKLVTNANETIDKYSSEIRKEKEKLVSANNNVDGLNQKIVSLESTIKELKNEMQLKCGLLAEKDVKFEHFKSSFNDMKDSSEQLKSEITAYEKKLILLQDERNCLKEELNTLVAKYTSTKQISDEVSLQNKELLEELECCNNKVTSINKKYQLSMVKNADVDDILEEYKQNIFNLEIALAENKLGLDALTEENLLLKSDNKCLIENELLNKEVIANKNKCIEMLQDDIKSLDERNFKKIKCLEQHLTEKTTEFEEYKKFRGHERSVRDTKLHKELGRVPEKNESCMMTNSHEINSPKESKKLMEEIHRLEKDISCKDKKLSFAQAELSKQATEIVNHQCQIDRLTAKYTAMKQKLNKPAKNLLTKDISNLNEKISTLSEQLVAKESELNELRISESNIKQREQSLCELSELVNILQQELDLKHTQISKEVEFYKSRLMEYEKRPPTVNKSINTSLPEEKSGDDSLSSKNGIDVDLQDLEIVMNNLKSTYQDDLNALHQSFKEKITQMDIGVDDGVSELQWINLMNT